MTSKPLRILAILSIYFVTSMTAHASNSISYCTAISKSDDDGETGRNNAINLIADSFLNGGVGNADAKFQKLDAIINEWSSSNCKIVDGRSRIDFIGHGFISAFERTSDWNLSYKKLQELRNVKPNSAYAIYAESVYWVAYAWEARGNEFASKVTPDGWRLFKDRLEKAEKLLLDNKETASTFPGWYQQIVDVKSALGKKEEADKMFYEGAARYKNYFPLYIVMRNYNEPKWGGSWKQVDDFVSWASNNAEASERSSMYARLYKGVYANMLSGQFFFKDTLVDWKKLKLSFEELVKQTPDSLANLAMFADLSCEANDKDTYIKLRNNLGYNIYDFEWFGNENQPVCDTKFGYIE